MEKPHTIRVLMVDAGHHPKISLGVARCLSRVPEVRLHVLSHEAGIPVRWSRHAKTCRRESIDNEDVWVDVVERLAKVHGIDVLLAVAEPGVRFLAKHRFRLERVAAVAAGPSVDSFDVAVNKARYTMFLEERGFRVPPTVLVRPNDVANRAIHDRINTLRPPLLLKPTRRGGGAGIQRFESAADVASHLCGLPEIQENAFIVQEIMSGCDICCVALCDAGKLVASSTYHALAAVNPYSPWSCSEFKVDEQVVEKTAEIVALLEWSGPANLDFIGSSDGELCSIEFNGRYDGSVPSSAQAGVNFPELHLALTQGLPVEQPAYTPGTYLDHRGLVEQTWARLRRKRHVKFGYRQTYLPLILRDPLPEAAMALSGLRSKLTR